MIGVALILVSVVVIAIYLLVELKKFKHQVWAFILIALVLFAYVSFAVTMKANNLSYRSPSDLMEATKIYFVWLGSIFINMKALSGHAVGMDWGLNETLMESKK